jgi:predicted TIM-barrel fold metal-dependent hydrolase/kynurenine formamidase
VPNRRTFIQEFAATLGGIFFANCGLLNASSTARQSGVMTKRREVMVGGRRALTVDVHSHCIIDIRDLVKDHEEGRSDPFLNPNRQRFLDATHVEDRLQHMDAHGIDIQAVSLFPSYSYWADRDLADRIVQLQNEKIAALCTAHPDRFVGLGAVALQHPDLAVEQMDYGVRKLGLRGFEIEGSVNGEDLSAPKFNLFWAKAEELGILAFIHPSGFAEGKQRLQGNGFLTNVIGNPLETTVALSHLIFDGTLDDLEAGGAGELAAGARQGFSKLGMENVPDIMTRGVLIDVAGLKNVDMLPENYKITPEDLEQALAREKVTLEPGDAVMINTGWGKLYNTDKVRYLKTSPGIGVEAGQWLVKQNPMLVGADNCCLELRPYAEQKMNLPIHAMLIIVNGIHIVENLKLDQLSTARAYETAYIMEVLKIKGGTGSTIAPIAVR